MTVSSSGELNARGEKNVIQKWVGVLRENKAAIVSALQSNSAPVASNDEARPAPDREAIEERAAIMEYDGGLSRGEAERRAVLDSGATWSWLGTLQKDKIVNLNDLADSTFCQP
ncbi:MAG: hypothetical protein LBJ59_09630 [Zoogloeaceae bacterium]|nr:hypothetical protein [Zoogloeaceae bacterium]